MANRAKTFTFKSEADPPPNPVADLNDSLAVLEQGDLLARIDLQCFGRDR